MEKLKPTQRMTVEEKLLTCIVYVIHFDADVPNHRDGDNRHYVGITQRLPSRVNQHIFGDGSRMTRYAFENEIGMSHTATTFGLTEKEVASRPRDFCAWCNGDTVVLPS